MAALVSALRIADPRVHDVPVVTIASYLRVSLPYSFALLSCFGIYTMAYTRSSGSLLRGIMFG